jgi:hypothetical protein
LGGEVQEVHSTQGFMGTIEQGLDMKGQPFP